MDSNWHPLDCECARCLYEEPDLGLLETEIGHMGRKEN